MKLVYYLAFILFQATILPFLMKLSLKQKLMLASLAAVVLMAVALTWLAALQLKQETQSNVQLRAQGIASTATKGISDWIGQSAYIVAAAEDNVDDAQWLNFYSKLVKRVDLTTSILAPLMERCVVLDLSEIVQGTIRVPAVGIKMRKVRVSKSLLKPIKMLSLVH